MGGLAAPSRSGSIIPRIAMTMAWITSVKCVAISLSSTRGISVDLPRGSRFVPVGKVQKEDEVTGQRNNNKGQALAEMNATGGQR